MSKPNNSRIPALRVVVQDVSDSDTAPSARRVSSWIKRSLGEEAHGELSIRIVSEAESAELNQRYRGRRGPTNVLAFSGTELPSGLRADERLLGDLVLCAPVVAREAATQGKAIDAHWAHIVIHGVLHLLGYDHGSDAQALRMERREAELLTALGFDDPYASER